MLKTRTAECSETENRPGRLMNDEEWSRNGWVGILVGWNGLPGDRFLPR